MAEMEKKLFRRGGMPVDASHGYATLWSQSGFFSPTAHGTFCAKPAGGVANKILANSVPVE
jgi:hypothetical protein